jgi:dihydrofolate reductase
MIKAIAAMDNNRLIGRGGGLPWPTIKEDFQWFKTFTANQYLVVGSTTYKTLPPLPGRKRDVIVIGGAKTYALFMDFIKEFYVTHVNGSYEGDTYMPPFHDSLNQTTLIASLENGHKIFRYTRN